MLEKFKNHLSENFPVLKGKKLLLAVSGGIDSMVMLNLFHDCNYFVSVAHVNFNLRGNDSDQDAEFVKSACDKINIPCNISSFNTKEYANEFKLSVQVAARQIRYQWFDELMLKEGFDFLLTAHHLDDSLETFLINFSRGTGLEGLTGIPQQNDRIIRPLLVFSRQEIENYAIENKVKWREDKSNASDKYLRNKLRHDVVPILKNLNSSFLESFQQTLENLQQTQSLAEDALRIVYRKVVDDIDFQKRIKIDELKILPNYNAYLYQWLKPFGFTAWSDIYNLVGAQSGKQVLSAHFRLLKDRNVLILEAIQNPDTTEYTVEENQAVNNLPVSLQMSSVTKVTNTESKAVIFVDKDKLKFPLTIRKWHEGDYFYPSGMTGRKKVGKYFKDEKYSLIDKENTWLLCSENQVIWIIGKRADNRFLANETTQNILKIALQ